MQNRNHVSLQEEKEKMGDHMFLSWWLFSVCVSFYIYMRDDDNNMHVNL